eukprot:14955021-Alexandrium_andersonii.AAC.1
MCVRCLACEAAQEEKPPSGPGRLLRTAGRRRMTGKQGSNGRQHTTAHNAPKSGRLDNYSPLPGD